MRFRGAFALLGLLFVVAFSLSLFTGSVQIPLKTFWTALLAPHTIPSEIRYIIFEMRFPATIMASVVGAGLALSGLQMQTLFRNPLADATVLGVSGGAGLGVAIFMLGGTLLSRFFSLPPFLQTGGMLLFAIVGASSVLLLIATLSYRSSDVARILIIGVMISFLSGSIISLLQYFAPAEMVKGFQVWSFGSLEGASRKHTFELILVVLPAIVLASLFPKALNALLLGDTYARSLGISTAFVRRSIILLTGILTGAITAFVGPIAFVGIAVPHLVRNLAATSNHRYLIPLTILGGASFLLICHTLSRLPNNGLVLPINVVTALFGAPIVIAVLIKKLH